MKLDFNKIVLFLVGVLLFLLLTTDVLAVSYTRDFTDGNGLVDWSAINGTWSQESYGFKGLCEGSSCLLENTSLNGEVITIETTTRVVSGTEPRGTFVRFQDSLDGNFAKVDFNYTHGFVVISETVNNSESQLSFCNGTFPFDTFNTVKVEILGDGTITVYFDSVQVCQGTLTNSHSGIMMIGATGETHFSDFSVWDTGSASPTPVPTSSPTPTPEPTAPSAPTLAPSPTPGTFDSEDSAIGFQDVISPTFEPVPSPELQSQVLGSTTEEPPVWWTQGEPIDFPSGYPVVVWRSHNGITWIGAGRESGTDGNYLAVRSELVSTFNVWGLLPSIATDDSNDFYLWFWNPSTEEWVRDNGTAYDKIIEYDTNLCEEAWSGNGFYITNYDLEFTGEYGFNGFQSDGVGVGTVCQDVFVPAPTITTDPATWIAWIQWAFSSFKLWLQNLVTSVQNWFATIFYNFQVNAQSWLTPVRTLIADSVNSFALFIYNLFNPKEAFDGDIGGVYNALISHAPFAYAMAIFEQDTSQVNEISGTDFTLQLTTATDFDYISPSYVNGFFSTIKGIILLILVLGFGVYVFNLPNRVVTK